MTAWTCLPALGPLLHVVIAVGAVADDAGLGGEIEDAAEASAVSLGAVKVAGAASGVAWNGHEAGGGGEVACVCVSAQVTGCDDELGSQDGAHARQGLDDVGLGVGVEGLPYLLVDVLEPVVQGEDLRGDVRGTAGRDILAGQRDVLSPGDLQGGGGDCVGVADVASPEPGGEAGLAVAPYGCRGLMPGEQDERAFVIGVAEGLFQRGKDPGEDVAEPVDRPAGNVDGLLAVGGE